MQLSRTMRCGLASGSRLVLSSARTRTFPHKFSATGRQLRTWRSCRFPAVYARGAGVNWPLVSPYDKDILGIAVPSLLTILLEPLLSLTDAAIIGKLGANALAGVGLSIYVFGFSNLLFSFLMIITTPAIAAAYQKQDFDEVSRITARGFWVGSICGIFMVFLVWVGAPAALQLFRAEPAVTELAVDYTRARVAGLFASFLLFVTAGTFRGAKDMSTLALVGLGSLFTNVVLACTFVFGLHWGIAGAGWATTLTQFAALAVSMTILVQRKWFSWPAMRQPPLWQELLPLLAAGAALQIRNISIVFVMFVTTVQVTAMGLSQLAAHEILRQLWAVSASLWGVFSIATQVLVASYLAKQDVAAARAVTFRGMQLAAVASLPFAITLLACREHLPRIFVTDPAVTHTASLYIPLLAVVMPIDSAEKALEGAFLGSKQVAWVARNTVVTSILCIAGIMASQTAGLGMLGLWIVIRFISIGRLIGGLARIANPNCPLHDGPR